jgi:hypothetical protein
MRNNVTLAFLVFALLVLLGPAGVIRANSLFPVVSDDQAIPCRVLEAHAAASPAVTVVLFHQQEKVDQDRLASLLREKTESPVMVKTGNAEWISATVIRLKDCFGRGLLLFPAGAQAPKEGETILLKAASAKSHE